ncbi:MAG: hypothetical protein NVS2B3_07480 [Vulcanimicrobiaceae bacterium]
MTFSRPAWLYAVLFCAVTASAASAQSTPAPPPSATPPGALKPLPSPSPVAPAPSATPYRFITISGFGDVGYTALSGTDTVRFTSGVPSRVFDGATGPFVDSNGGRTLAPANDFNRQPNLHSANVALDVNGPFIGGKIETTFGTDADVLASNGQSRSGANVTQAYLQATRGPVTLVLGKFSTLAGAEVLEAPSDTNFSRSYLFGEAIPFTHTGARLTYAYNSKLSIVAGINNGWDDTKFVGKKKTLEGGLQLTPSPGYALTLSTYNGNDFALGGTPDFAAVFTNRMLYDGVLTVHPTSALTLVANYDNGTQVGDDASRFATSHWNGVAGYATYRFNSLYALSLRSETFHDAQGFRSGIVQRLLSNTATLSYTPNSNLIFRGEYRADGSDGPNFGVYRDGALLSGGQQQHSFGFETIVKFP